MERLLDSALLRLDAATRRLQARVDTLRSVQGGEVVGNDGLTEHERLELLVEFRSTVGAKPAYTKDDRIRRDAVMDSLRTSEPRPHQWS